MNDQEIKSRWIQAARDSGMQAIIIYKSDISTFCWQVEQKMSLSVECRTLEEDGYEIIEEIRL